VARSPCAPVWFLLRLHREICFPGRRHTSYSVVQQKLARLRPRGAGPLGRRTLGWSICLSGRVRHCGRLLREDLGGLGRLAVRQATSPLSAVRTNLVSLCLFVLCCLCNRVAGQKLRWSAHTKLRSCV
jgi:hypothetical protein